MIILKFLTGIMNLFVLQFEKFEFAQNGLFCWLMLYTYFILWFETDSMNGKHTFMP